MAHRLLQLRLETVISRFAIKDHGANAGPAWGARSDATVCTCPVGIDLIRIGWNHDPGRGHYGRDQVDIVGGDRQVNRTGSYVAEGRRPAPGYLALNIKVPVQDVRSFRVLVYKPVPDLVRIKTDVRVNAAAQGCGGVKADNLERSSCRGIESEFIREW